jgi:hypothetical protein
MAHLYNWFEYKWSEHFWYSALQLRCQVRKGATNVALIVTEKSPIDVLGRCTILALKTMDKKFERVALSELRQGRRGKHNELMVRILEELATLPEGEAIKVPLDEIKGVSVANLRAALARATSARGLKIATYSDVENFYFWARTKKTARYEREVKRAQMKKS